MQIFHKFSLLPKKMRNSVFAIGNFDGLHIGHRTLIDEARKLSREYTALLGVLTFDPHPREYFRPNQPSFRLTPRNIKLELLESWGIDFTMNIPFNDDLSNTEAVKFIEKHLVENLGVRAVVVGHDFAFGKNREGNVSLLKKFSRKNSFNLKVVEPQLSRSGNLYSSRSIRELLQSGKPKEAANFLGRWWSIRGKVIKGDQRGRVLGYPTANIKLDAYLQPSLGIYAVWTKIEGEGYWYKSAASLGVRPTFDGEGVLLEVYLMGFSGDLYGKNLEVKFIEYLRPEEKFLDIDSLKKQMELDCKKSEDLLEKKDFSVEYFSK